MCICGLSLLFSGESDDTLLQRDRFDEAHYTTLCSGFLCTVSPSSPLCSVLVFLFGSAFIHFAISCLPCVDIVLCCMKKLLRNI